VLWGFAGFFPFYRIGAENRRNRVFLEMLTNGSENTLIIFFSPYFKGTWKLLFPVYCLNKFLKRLLHEMDWVIFYMSAYI
jgi:hypothetical protein